MTHYGEGRRPDVEAEPRQIDASLRKFREPQQLTKKAFPPNHCQNHDFNRAKV